MSSNRVFLLWSLAALLVGNCARAEQLQTLGIAGSVVEAEPFYTRLVQSSLPISNVKLSAADRRRVARWSGFEGYDSGLQKVSFAPRPISLDQARRLITPICLIANDAESRAWLQRVQAVLRAQKAVCYLVRLDAGRNGQSVNKLIKNVPVIALDPSLAIEAFNVPGYPALISKSGVEQ